MLTNMVTETSTELIREPATALEDCRLAFIGCGAMAEAMIAGLLRKKLINPDNIVGSHPRLARREELHVKYGIEMLEHNRDAVLEAAPDESRPGSMVILAVKPQRLTKVLQELKGSIHPDQLIVSVVAGAKLQTITDELLHAAVVRTMPNTPAQIGEGVTAWTASAAVTDKQETYVRALLEALGKTVRVENERQIDMATALSATGPTYIFLVMEALIDAGVHMGFSRHVAEELVHQAMLGSVLFARESHKHPAELRNMVTSPGGTSAEAIYQMEKGSLRTVLSKAVWAAFQKAQSLGEKRSPD
jgi:pyrroline-5-carboxylate reductase